MNEKNIKIGNATEKSSSSILRAKGFWSYNCPKSSAGSQPVDLITIKGVKDSRLCRVLLCDAKHVRVNEVSFSIDRIEPNQWASLDYLHGFANVHIDNLGFIINFERTGDYYWLPYKTALELVKNNEKSINLSRLSLLEEFLNEYED